MQTTIILWIISVLSIASSTVVYLDNETHDLIQFARDVAIINKINPKLFVKLIECESRWKIKAAGDWSSEKKRHEANGILQFWRGTFSTQSKKYDFKGEYTNPQDQIILAAKMLQEKDGIYHWKNCGLYIKWIK